VLAAAGGVAGVVLGRFALDGLKVLASGLLGVSQSGIRLDGRVLGFTALATILTSLLFGLYPALQTARTDLRTALARGGNRGGTGHSQGWARQSLIVAEVSLSVVLLVCAGLLIRTLIHLTGLNPGFDSSNVVTASLSLQDVRYGTVAKVMKLFDESLERIRRMPGVEVAGIGLTLPYERALNDGFTRLDGPHPSGQQEITNVIYVTPGYFEALRMTLLRGRMFTASDRAGSQSVVVVNDAFARKYLRDQEAVGSHIRTVGADRQIVGVMGGVQQRAGWGGFGPAGLVPCLYVPAAQTNDGYLQLIHTWFSPSWVVRSAGAPRGIIAGLQSAVASVDPELPFAGFRTMDQVRSRAFSFERLNATLAGILAGLALLLAAVGIYGLIANSVAERTRELGIRMALGATVAQAIVTVSAAGIRLALLGLLLGCIVALATARVLRTLLWGIAPNDALTFAAVCGGLLLVAGLASLLPGLRVVRIHPAQTLREE
ncbi:MAG: ABC transporter permease, partial [Bryobacteraceae bacterium]